MEKARTTSLEEMNEEQVKEDISMTPLARLHLAFQISDFALELRSQQEPIGEEPSSINWIVVRKTSRLP